MDPNGQFCVGELNLETLFLLGTSKLNDSYIFSSPEPKAHR